MDASPAPVEVLPDIVEAVGEKVSKGDVATTMGGALAVARSIGYVYWGERAEERAEERTSQREKERERKREMD